MCAFYTLYKYILKYIYIYISLPPPPPCSFYGCTEFAGLYLVTQAPRAE